MMIRRTLYQVIAYIVDANGTFNNLSGYPKNFDSKHYDNDLDKTYRRAYGDYCDVVGAMSKIDNRQLQTAMLIRINDGLQLQKTLMGDVADLPDPEPEAEE